MVDWAVTRDRLCGPLETSGEEPGEGEDDPPHAARHGEEVDEDKDRGAEYTDLTGARGWHPHSCDQSVVIAQSRPRSLELTRNGVMASGDSDEVAGGHQEVAQGQVHDGSLRIVEPSWVHEEGGEGEGGGETAEDGPDTQPQLGELSVLGGEVWGVAGGGTVVSVSPLD